MRAAIEDLPRLVDADPQLLRRGRYVSASFLLEVGDDSYLVHVAQGRVAAVDRGPFVMPSWTFALRASPETWAEFWAERPEPGSHDLFALVKKRALLVEGDLHPFMSNLLYFKGVFATLRGEPAS